MKTMLSDEDASRLRHSSLWEKLQERRLTHIYPVSFEVLDCQLREQISEPELSQHKTLVSSSLARSIPIKDYLEVIMQKGYKELTPEDEKKFIRAVDKSFLDLAAKLEEYRLGRTLERTVEVLGPTEQEVTRATIAECFDHFIAKVEDARDFSESVIEDVKQIKKCFLEANKIITVYDDLLSLLHVRYKAICREMNEANRLAYVAALRNARIAQGLSTEAPLLPQPESLDLGIVHGLSFLYAQIDSNPDRQIFIRYNHTWRILFQCLAFLQQIHDASYQLSVYYHIELVDFVSLLNGIFVEQKLSENQQVGYIALVLNRAIGMLTYLKTTHTLNQSNCFKAVGKRITDLKSHADTVLKMERLLTEIRTLNRRLDLAQTPLPPRRSFGISTQPFVTIDEFVAEDTDPVSPR